MRRAAGLVALALLACACEPTGRFDGERWRNARGMTADDNPRGAMVTDVGRILRPGMTRAEIVALLGVPNGEGGGRLSYDLGFPPRGDSYRYFEIVLDADGRLVHTAIARD